MRFREQVLDNGMEIVAECNEAAYSTSLGFFVRTGSRDESDENSGVSHFLEHMVFKGTPTRSAADVNRELDEMGSNSNAFTSEEQTVYYATVLPEYQNQATALLADILRPSLRAEDFVTEQQVIVEEIRKYEDQPPFGAHEKCMAAYFGDHPLGRSILGTVDSVTALTPESMGAYFRQRYSPQNMVLVAAGNVNFDSLVRTATAATRSWERVETNREKPAATPRRGLEVVHKADALQQYATQICAGSAARAPERYASRVLATVLGDDGGSRYYWALVDTGLAEYAAVSPYEFQGCGILMTFICCAPEEMNLNLERIADIQRETHKSGITEDELDLAKSKISSQIVLRSERPASRLFAIGNGWIQRRSYKTVKESVEGYQAVSRSDVQGFLDSQDLTLSTTVTTGPLTELQVDSATVR